MRMKINDYYLLITETLLFLEGERDIENKQIEQQEENAAEK